MVLAPLRMRKQRRNPVVRNRRLGVCGSGGMGGPEAGAAADLQQTISRMPAAMLADLQKAKP